MEIADYPAGEAAASRWVQNFPYDEFARWLLFSSQHIQGRMDSAFQSLLQVPASTAEGIRLRRNGNAQKYLWLGDGSNLLNISREMLNAGETENAARFEGIAHAVLGDTARAQAAFERLLRMASSGSVSRGYLLIATLRASVGDLSGAEATLTRGVEHDQTGGESGLLAAKLIALGYLAWIRNAPTQARSYARQAMQGGGDPDIWTKSIMLLYRAGYVRDADELATELRMPEQYPRFAALRELIRAEALTAADKPEAAVLKIGPALRFRSATQAPESLLYALRKSGDVAGYNALAARVTRNPCYTWASPEQQFGPIRLLITKLNS